jgi:hypothetical protein
MGGGRDSIALALLLAHYDDPWVVKHFPQAAREASRYRDEDPDRDVLAIFSDTGIEYPYTYEALDKLERHLRRSPHPFDLVRLSKPRVPSAVMVAALSTASPIANQPWTHGRPGESAAAAARRGKFHTRPALWAEHLARGTMTARDNSSCTDNQKIQVLRRFRQDLAAQRFDVPGLAPWRERGRQRNDGWASAVERGDAARHRTLIGIHVGERERVDLRKGGRWPARIVPSCRWTGKGRYVQGPDYNGSCYHDAVEDYHYPLVDWNIGEPEEDAILAHFGFADVHKSGCRHCHWQSRDWWWALAQTDPSGFEEAVAMELGNLARRAHVQSLVRSGRLGVDSKPVRDTARGRQMTPHQLVQLVRGGQPMFKTMMLSSSRYAPLPCEVAFFARHHRKATPTTVWSRAYRRGGGAA